MATDASEPSQIDHPGAILNANIYLLLMLQTSSGAEAVQASTVTCCKYMPLNVFAIRCDAQVCKIAMSLQ